MCTTPHAFGYFVDLNANVMCVCMLVCLYKCTYACMHTCVHMFVCIYKCKNVFIYQVTFFIAHLVQYRHGIASDDLIESRANKFSLISLSKRPKLKTNV